METKTRFKGSFKVNVQALIYVLNDNSFFYVVNTEGQTSELSQYRQLLSVVCDSAMFLIGYHKIPKVASLRLASVYSC